MYDKQLQTLINLINVEITEPLLKRLDDLESIMNAGFEKLSNAFKTDRKTQFTLEKLPQIPQESGHGR